MVVKSYKNFAVTPSPQKLLSQFMGGMCSYLRLQLVPRVFRVESKHYWYGALFWFSIPFVQLLNHITICHIFCFPEASGLPPPYTNPVQVMVGHVIAPGMISDQCHKGATPKKWVGVHVSFKEYSHVICRWIPSAQFRTSVEGSWQMLLRHCKICSNSVSIPYWAVLCSWCWPWEHDKACLQNLPQDREGCCCIHYFWEAQALSLPLFLCQYGVETGAENCPGLNHGVYGCCLLNHNWSQKFQVVYIILSPCIHNRPVK